jgi:hypothetical protein
MLQIRIHIVQDYIDIDYSLPDIIIILNKCIAEYSMYSNSCNKYWMFKKIFYFRLCNILNITLK